MSGTSATSGGRVLVVEDTVLIADLIAEELQDRGYAVIGPVGRVSEALALVRSERLDGALLDVNLAGELCFPIADLLTERGVPFAFLTGYGESLMPPAYQATPRLTKPFQMERLARLVSECFGGGGDPAR